jgi:hypothetical protein
VKSTSSRIGRRRLFRIGRFLSLALAASSVFGSTSSLSATPVDVIRSVGGLPAHIAASFDEPIGFVQATSGEYLVLDRRAHTVYIVDAKKSAAKKLVQIGFESGRILGPGVLAIGPNDLFAVADGPGKSERIQLFSLAGTWSGGFYLDTRVAERLVVGPIVLNGVGSMHYTGTSFLVNQPESGALISELNTQGHVVRRIGTLRTTGHEADADVHLALNVGIPLADPAGGYFFVFQTGVPVLRKYDASGTLVFERHLEGPELDADIRGLPTTWPRRTSDHLPIVPPLVRAAAVDHAGRVWVSFMQPYTYVYDARGEKIRTVQFQAAGTIAPTSLFFTADDRLLVTPGCYEFATK